MTKSELLSGTTVGLSRTWGNTDESGCQFWCYNQSALLQKFHPDEIDDPSKTRARKITRDPNPYRNRLDGRDRSARRQVLGRPDTALFAALQYWQRCDAARNDPRFGHPEEGLRAGESGARQIAGGKSKANRAGMR